MQITVRSVHPRRARLAQEGLRDAGVAATVCTGLKATPIHEDIALLDVAEGDVAWALSAATELRARAHPPRVIAALAPLSLPPTLAQALDAWVQSDAAAAIVQRDLRDLFRAVVAREELEARRATARALDATPIASEPLPGLRCLFIGEPHPFYLGLTHSVAALGGHVDAAFSSFLGFDQLHDAPFDATIVNSSADPALALMLCGAMRRNKRLTQMPTVVLGAAGAFAVEAGERGASLVLDSAVAADTALAWVHEKIRRGRRARQTDMDLALSRPPSGTAHAFMEAHLSTLAERAHQQGFALSVATLQVSAAPGSHTVRRDDWVRGVSETCDVARRLVRSADSVCLMPEDIIVIAFPATTRTGAMRAVERVASVAECTAFAAGEKDAGPIVLARHVAELAPGESGARLLGRVLDFHARVGVTA